MVVLVLGRKRRSALRRTSFRRLPDRCAVTRCYDGRICSSAAGSKRLNRSSRTVSPSTPVSKADG